MNAGTLVLLGWFAIAAAGLQEPSPLPPGKLPSATLLTHEERGRIRTRLSIAGAGCPATRTYFETGPAVGEMLNHHYFVGLQCYSLGLYEKAEFEMSYVIDRPQFLKGNPRIGEFMSTSYYVRAMIYLYHSEGIGRHTLAKVDLESAIQWNPSNHMAYLELSRLYAGLDMKDNAVLVLRYLLSLKPQQAIAEDAKRELAQLSGD